MTDYMLYVSMLTPLDDIFYLPEDHEDWKLIKSKYSYLVKISKKIILLLLGK
jgi:hypothetical protein